MKNLEITTFTQQLQQTGPHDIPNDPSSLITINKQLARAPAGPPITTTVRLELFTMVEKCAAASSSSLAYSLCCILIITLI